MKESLIVLRERYWELKKVESDIESGIISGYNERIESLQSKLKDLETGIYVLSEGEESGYENYSGDNLRM